MGPLISLFWTSGDVSSGFQSQSGQPYSHLVEAYVIYIPWDSPLVQHLPVTSPHACFSRGRMPYSIGRQVVQIHLIRRIFLKQT